MFPRLLLRSAISTASRRCCSSETLRPSFEAAASPQPVVEANLAQTSESFGSLLRKSSFVQLGDPIGKIVVGKIYHVVDDDLYIDFGHKFPCVCMRPRGRNSHLYTRGAEVRLKIKKLELSQTFLGYEKEMSLLESDCVLLGLYRKAGS